MTKVFLSFLLSLLLFSQSASAHHVFGIEVSPAFELFHGFAEPLLFALSGFCLARFLSKRVSYWLWATLAASSVALAFALASVLEEGAGLFLLWDALAFALFYAVAAQRLQRGAARKCF